MKPTEEQKQAIESRKKNVVVSASAGSGKTGTMVLRVIDLIKEGVTMDHIVMLTFTENAAGEMMSRLSDALFREIRSATGEARVRLMKAHDDLPMLSCGTIDSFCFKLIMAHFEQLGLSPLHTIVEKKASDAMKKRIFNSVVRARYAEGGEDFIEFFAQFGNKEETLYDAVKSVYECWITLEERAAAIDEWERIASLDLGDIPAVRYFLEAGKARRDAFVRRFEALSAEAEAAGAKEISAQSRHRIKCAKNIAFSSLKDLLLSFGSKEKEDTPKIYQKERTTFAELYDRYCKLDAANTKFLKKFKDPFAEVGGYEEACDAYRHAARSVRELLALVRVFDVAYKKAKEEKKLLDFADLEQYALELLEKAEIRGELACEHVLVDEKQDVNPIQDRLVRLLSGEHSLFSVGDVKQSIFRFRQGAPEIFQELMREGRSDPENSDVILFNKNFRSSRAVISFVNEVFETLMTEEFGGVDYSEAPLCGRDPVAEDGRPVIDVGYVHCRFFDPALSASPAPLPSEITSVYDLREADRLLKENASAVDEEAEWVRDRISEVVGTRQFDAKEGKYFTVEYKHIAILSRSRGGVCPRVISCLREARIPLSLGAFKEDGQTDEERQLADLMRLVLSPYDDYAFVSVLRSPMFEFDLDEIARVSLLEGRSFYDKAKAYAENADGAKMRAFLEYLARVRFDSSVLPVADLLSRVIEERFRIPLLREADGRLRFGSLRAFVSEVRAKRVASVAEFLDYFDNEYQGTEGEIADGNAVTFMTIHGSKGLEFPVVFLINTGAELFSRKAYSAALVVDKIFGVHKRVVEKDGKILKNPSFKLVMQKKRQEEIEDSLRLMYVALTRAQNVLYVTGKRSPARIGAIISVEEANSMAEWISFAVPTLPKGAPPTELPPVEEREEVTTEKSFFVEEENVIPTRMSEDGKNALRDAFSYDYPYKTATKTGIKYTVTGINTMDDDGYYPPKPLFSDSEDKAARGTALHAVMENIPFTTDSTEEVRACLQNLTAIGILTEEEGRSADAAVILDAVRKVRDKVDGYTVMREKTFMLQLPASAPEIGLEGVDDPVVIQGKVDLLAVGEKDAVILDYKCTSKSDDDIVKSYTKQLELYVRAVKAGLGIEDVVAYIFVLGRNRFIQVCPPKD